MIRGKLIRALAVLGFATLIMVALAGCGAKKDLGAGSTWEIPETTELSALSVADGAAIKAPEGYSVTMTVDGVETAIVPGTYKGNIVLTKAEDNVVKYRTLTHYFRQALYLDKAGIVASKSVLPAAGKYTFSNNTLDGAAIKSVGENFNGIYVAGGAHTVKNATIDFTGNGGNDFAGYGAAVMATGKDTTLVLDGARIRTHGAVRTAVVATGSSNVVVKNSDIATMDGVLPPDYVPNVTLGEMKAVPWMLGLSGNCRATNILGADTKATYINSSISSEKWGVLSQDDGTNDTLTAINCKITNTGKVGYGAFSNTSFYGCDIDAGDYAVVGGGIFAASNPEIVAKLNTDLKLGLTPDEIKSLAGSRTTVKSGRFGLMLNGSVKIMDDTVFDTEKAIFLIKGSSPTIEVDGSKGAQLNPKNGIILQMMDGDDPGPRDADGKMPVDFNGKMLNTGVYEEFPPPVKDRSFDVTTPNKSDVIATFVNIALKGDFYNAGARRGGLAMVGGSSGPSGKNLVLNLQNAKIAGVVTSSTARHAKDTITAADYLLLGEVTNTPSAAINNGVIVSLTGSTWTVTGTSYLTNLTLGKDSAVVAPDGHKLTMTVDGAPREIKAGTYKGKIVLTVSSL
jgi:hypothetical protein